MMLLRLAFLIAALLFATIAQAQTEPRPGTVAGLDLSSPQAGAESFIRAWLDEDYFVAWLAMDPEKRYRFHYDLQGFNYTALFGNTDLAGNWDQFAAFVAESQSPEQVPGIVIDAFADFGGMMHLAKARRSLPLTFASTAADELKPEAPTGTLARVQIAPAAGGGTLVLQQSPSGLWRFLGMEGRDLPTYWLYTEPSEEEAED